MLQNSEKNMTFLRVMARTMYAKRKHYFNWFRIKEEPYRKMLRNDITSRLSPSNKAEIAMIAYNTKQNMTFSIKSLNILRVDSRQERLS